MNPETFSIEDIQNMSMEDYALYRGDILRQFGKQMEHEALTAMGITPVPASELDVIVEVDALLVCYYCGVQCDSTENREEHEEECGTV